MNLTVPRKNLASCMNRIMRVVKAETTMAILKNVLLTADAGGLELYANAVDHSLRIKVPNATINGHGQACVRGDDFGRIVSSLSAGELSLVSQGTDKLLLSAGGGQYEFAGAIPTEYPILTPAIPIWSVRINPKLLTLALPVPMNALNMSQNVVNEPYKVVSFVFGKERLELCGTDSARMGFAVMPLAWETTTSEEEPQCLVRGNVLDSLKALIADAEEDMVLGAGPSDTIVSTSEWTFQANVLMLKYPNYRRVFAKFANAEQFEATMDREELEGIVSRLRIFGKSDRSDRDCLTMRVMENLVMLEAAGDKGAASEEMSCPSNGELTCSLHGDYLAKLLASISGEEVVMRYSHDQAVPIRFHEFNSLGLESTSLLMPLSE